MQRENYSKRSDTGKLKILQWEVSNSDQTSVSNTSRCLNGRLRSQLHGYGDLGEMVSRREEIAYEYPRTPSDKKCHLSFYKRENNQCNSYPARQQNCPLVPSENERYDRQDTFRFTLIVSGKY